MPGLTSLPDAPAIARIVRAATGETPSDLRIAGQGVTAVGWRAETSQGPVCVLIELPEASRQPGESANLHARVPVMAALHERDPRCPRPIASSASDSMPESLRGGLPWLVTTWLEGEPVEAMTDDIARDLGTLLAALHSIPCEGYGLLEDTADAVRGRETERGAAMVGRWYEGLWPFDGRALLTHPLARVEPRLLEPVGALRGALLRYAEPPAAAAVCHTDVNPSHVLVREGLLAGLIDFGDVAIVPPAFDIASFAYYSGWTAVEALLEGYAPNAVLRDVRRAEAQQLAVALALQKVEKHTKRRPDEERLRHAVAVLEETLPLATRRMDA
jgi:Ser/Thr protein kinase RdoA (MazF antagonist)